MIYFNSDIMLPCLPFRGFALFDSVGKNMNLEKVTFGFFIVLALTLNYGFVLGDIDNPDHHHVYELFAVIVVNLVATIIKLGDRTQMGAVLLSTSLVAVLQLITAAVVWTIAVHVSEVGLTSVVMSSIVSLASGAWLANVVSVIILIIETVMLRR
jgi:Ca2+/H+ antiporter, TMEM165/GDT1 family